MSVILRLGRGSIDSDLLKLPKVEFVDYFSQDFKRAMFLNNSDEEIEKILSDLWDGSNPESNGSNQDVLQDGVISDKPSKTRKRIS